ncbi:MAG: hypothetical protein L6R00_06510 [Phycisphaerae bacterium]|nr:hypothetical protein [Phycisphaerae bacterium]
MQIGEDAPVDFNDCSEVTWSRDRVFKSDIKYMRFDRIRNGDKITSADQVDLLFSLTCARCDAGIDIDSFDEAVQAGWREIIRDSRGIAWNYIGLCPECRSKESAE